MPLGSESYLVRGDDRRSPFTSVAWGATYLSTRADVHALREIIAEHSRYLLELGQVGRRVANRVSLDRIDRYRNGVTTRGRGDDRVAGRPSIEQRGFRAGTVASGLGSP